MIIKYFELKKRKIKNNKYFLLYGRNEGLIEETINNILRPSLPENSTIYDENEILKDETSLIENLSTKSFFDNEKLLIIKRCSDKIVKFVNTLIEKNFKDVFLILISGSLEKKSKLRAYFEKEKKTVCIPFYEDNNQTLNLLATNFFKNKKINISQQNINLLIERSRGDRKNLNNELNKIENFSKNKKKIDFKDILQITNLSENHDIGELVDNSLAKNEKRTLYILNENNFNQEDLIIILRTFLSRLKRLLKIKIESFNDPNLDKIISNFKPPIFWKNKDIIKKQLQILEFQKIKDLIVKTNDTEYLLKKNPDLSHFLVRNFILERVQNINS